MKKLSFLWPLCLAFVVFVLDNFAQDVLPDKQLILQGSIVEFATKLVGATSLWFSTLLLSLLVERGLAKDGYIVQKMIALVFKAIQQRKNSRRQPKN